MVSLHKYTGEVTVKMTPVFIPKTFIIPLDKLLYLSSSWLNEKSMFLFFQIKSIEALANLRK